MRKILVAVKKVVDYNTRVRVKADGSGVVLDGVKMSLNPFDEIALEEALRIRERGQAGEVIVVSIGADDVQQHLRTALAMGADRAVLVKTEAVIEPLIAAQVLLAVAKQEGAELVLLGKQAIDDDANQTGQMLAALWDRPQATFASKVELKDNVAVVTREVDAGLETIEVDLPAVITSDLRLNEPRYIKLPEIMKAKKKPLAVTEIGALGVTPAQQHKVLKTEAPAQRARGAMVKDTAELVAALRKIGVVA
jgi:electron transfer flavoprotein beta subunit